MIGRFAFVACIVATPAYACSPPLPDTRTPAQVTADIRRQFDQATDLVQVRMSATATPADEGRAIVLRSLKNARRPGTVLRIRTMEASACGYGDAPKGSTHWLYLNGSTPQMFAPIGPQVATTLTRLGILPTR